VADRVVAQLDVGRARSLPGGQGSGGHARGFGGARQYLDHQWGSLHVRISRDRTRSSIFVSARARRLNEASAGQAGRGLFGWCLDRGDGAAGGWPGSGGSARPRFTRAIAWQGEDSSGRDGQ
jgi:hypothetical protein